jgi:hypothetical protein
MTVGERSSAADQRAAEERTAEEREQRQLEAFLAHTARTPSLRARLQGVDPYEVVKIAATEGFDFGVFTLHRTVCTGYAMPRVRQSGKDWRHWR